ncbi:flagellar biosynthesis protein FlgJ [Dyella sp. M7H15-1]|uniref:flagellar biosynthesis protein FlgJ n=1 Tax=Dyella sp. M7H15-1 TaxID=2501295 RepID=UPI0010050B7C|nr:flagellar biosynthesis protein FlgJ [Dyella sp. M7H15-1]QAU23978.1 flagellar biosynthesis protein FlgJ [Dyella sp. M7H15-1]
MNVLPFQGIQNSFELGETGIKPGDAGYREKLERVAEQFEGMFIAHLLSEMRKATEQMNPDSASASHKPGAALMDEAYRRVADDIARQRAFGITDSIVAQMMPNDAAPCSLSPPGRGLG